MTHLHEYSASSNVKSECKLYIHSLQAAVKRASYYGNM